MLLPLYFITPWIDFAHVSIPIWLRWAGLILTWAGIALFAWTHLTLGVNWTAVLAIAEKHELVTNGPYRYVRHPMYSAFFVIGFGFLFFSANWLVGVIYLGALLLMYMTRVSAEEQMLLERFGESYRQYMKTTGRILPKSLPTPRRPDARRQISDRK